MSTESCTGEEVKHKEKSHLLDEFMDTSASGSAGFFSRFSCTESLKWMANQTEFSHWHSYGALISLCWAGTCVLSDPWIEEKIICIKDCKVACHSLNVQLGTDYTDYFYNIVLIMRSFNKITLVSLCKKEIVDHLFNRSIDRWYTVRLPVDSVAV